MEEREMRTARFMEHVCWERISSNACQHTSFDIIRLYHYEEEPCTIAPALILTESCGTSNARVVLSADRRTAPVIGDNI